MELSEERDPSGLRLFLCERLVLLLPLPPSLPPIMDLILVRPVKNSPFTLVTKELVLS